MGKCSCDFNIKMVGDGCRYCQPQTYIDKMAGIIEDMEKEVAADGAMSVHAQGSEEPGTEAGKGETAGGGYDKLHCWFGLSYASFLTLPRVLMNAMHDEWQGKMADLLNEYDEAFPHQPHIGTRVQITKDGKLTKTPRWIIDYRRPYKATIDQMRGGSS